MKLEEEHLPSSPSGLASLLFVAAYCLSKHRLVEVLVIGWHAEVFPQLRARDQLDRGLRGYPWLRVSLGIDDGEFGLQRPVVQALIAFHDLHLVAVRPASVGIALGKPGPFVITVRLNNESITLPMADVPSHPVRLRRLLRKFPSVRPDRSPGMVYFENLKHSVGEHHELKSVIVCVQPRPSIRIAIDRAACTPPGSVFRVKRGSVRTLISECNFALFLSPLRQRGH